MIALAVLAAGVRPLAAAPRLRPARAVGAPLGSGAAAWPAPPATAGGGETPAPAWSVVPVAWSSFVGPDAAAAWRAFDERMAVAAAGDRPTVLLVRGGAAPGLGDPRDPRGFRGPDGAAGSAAERDAFRKSFSDFLRDLARRAAGRAAWFLLADVAPAPGSPDDARLADYELKSASVTLRSEAPGAGVGALAAGEAELDLLLRAYAVSGDLAPYLDAVGLRAGAADEADLGAAARRLRAALLTRDAGASIWMVVPTPPRLSAERTAEEAAARALELLDGGADLAIVDPGAEPDAARLALAGVAAALGRDAGAAPKSTSGVEPTAGAEALRWTYFFDDRNFREIIVVWGKDAAVEGAAAGLELETNLRRAFHIYEATGRGAPGARVAPAARGKVLLELRLARRPSFIVVERDRTSPAGGLKTEETAARGAHVVTAEEIIAAHQVWRAFQDARLASVARTGEITFRLRYGQVTGTFDVSVRGDYSWDRGTGGEWTIKDTYFNGVRLSWDKFPEAPFIGKEKVVALPLELTFDRRYAYVLEGEDVVEGRRCWRLRFEPRDRALALVGGRAWIEQKTAALAKTTTIQTKLKPPAAGDEETQTYEPIEGPDGTVFWLPREIDGQQLYAVSGGNLVVLRRVTFGPPRINDPRFAEERRAAYASTRQMIRETPEGYKWLDRNPDGTRRVLEKGNPRQLFAVAGLYKDQGTDGVAPLGGIDYTDIDAFGRGAILNVFFAGPLLNVSLNKAGLFGTRWDGAATLNAVGFARFDKDYDLGKEIEARRLRRLEQTLRLNLGHPIGRFAKIKGTLDLSYLNFHRDETTRSFTPPPNTLETTGQVELSYDRRGWGVAGRWGAARRATWAPWGPDGALVSGAELDRARSYRTWGVSAQKTFFLPYFQKLEFGADYRAARDVDRFSAYQFGLLGGTRVRGFGGAGIRFDRGAVFSVGYGFNLGEGLRFDAGIDHARVHDPSVAPGATRATGIGAAASLAGPWRTILRFDVGYALRSDLAEARGDKEFFVLALRLF